MAQAGWSNVFGLSADTDLSRVPGTADDKIPLDAHTHFARGITTSTSLHSGTGPEGGRMSLRDQFHVYFSRDGGFSDEV